MPAIRRFTGENNGSSLLSVDSTPTSLMAGEYKAYNTVLVVLAEKKLCQFWLLFNANLMN